MTEFNFTFQNMNNSPPFNNIDCVADCVIVKEVHKINQTERRAEVISNETLLGVKYHRLNMAVGQYQ